MLNQIHYQFATAPEANRFLNELKHWSKGQVSAKLYKSSRSVSVSYEIDSSGFDYTISELDDLAQTYNGEEI
ncbi:MAG: hypothetical protein P8Q24_10220 [Glaciecola sp.]|jgi:hypothetical protein|nr:hypothetical protein [Glaciecola sp.]MDG1469518.1 hypothetical protein [Glaciecola sp.]MDG1923457.1 hypothetical protein [Glaciecola sp.]